MKLQFSPSSTLLACLALVAIALPMSHQNAQARSDPNTKGVAVAYPWLFENGTDTARLKALDTAEEIAGKAGFMTIPGDMAAAIWTDGKMPRLRTGHLPTRATLRTFAREAGATTVLYGSVSWHTRSIWVNAGPKTISTATVSVYVYDAASNKVVFSRTDVQGRSDEKSNGYKLAAAVLATPLVTMVSGGPATPQEQRAVQIAMGNAYYGWIHPAR